MRRLIAAAAVALTLVVSTVQPAGAITCPGGCAFVGSDSGSSLTGEGYFDLVAHGIGTGIDLNRRGSPVPDAEVRRYTLVAHIAYSSENGLLRGGGSIHVFNSATSTLMYEFDVVARGTFANIDNPNVPHDAVWAFAAAERSGPDVVTGNWTPLGGGVYRGEIAYAGSWLVP